ncbi:hypothetical protein GCM10009837_06920 [Streptomyces durmitorensis]|uniref:DUF4254 domain-containing protein n=1 Tax=Streptomyces durmitorensis TaxID=319947 RepID=A0ABY4PLY4_9ACTN|nr:hypothetical protein [Streptomyces durmitorensis]UQT54412.1 hypothetical protein M4V62_04520 [Streptomyces durmitorensis]
MTETPPAVWIDGDPLMEAMAASVWDRCQHSDSGLVIDDPRNIAVAAVSALRTTPADRDLRDRVTEIVNRLAAHAKGFQDVLDESDRGPWGRLVCGDIDELRTALADPALADRAAVPPRVFADGGVNDLRELYALHHVLRDAGVEPTRPIHKAIDALRSAWDRELRREQLRRMAAAKTQPVEPRCTCGDAGPAFAPAGHYADYPQAGEGR